MEKETSIIFAEQPADGLVSVSAIRGGGMSYYANVLLAEALKSNKNVRIIDVGQSYKRMSKKVDAVFR